MYCFVFVGFVLQSTGRDAARQPIMRGFLDIWRFFLSVSCLHSTEGEAPRNAKSSCRVSLIHGVFSRWFRVAISRRLDAARNADMSGFFDRCHSFLLASSFCDFLTLLSFLEMLHLFFVGFGFTLIFWLFGLP